MALKFNGLSKKKSIDWKDGAILNFEFPYLAEMMKKYPAIFSGKEDSADIVRLGADMIFDSLIGWTGIEIGETGTALPFNEENKKLIFDEIIVDVPLIEKIIISLKGPSSNLETGSRP